MVARGHDDRPHLFADKAVLVVEADRPGLALLGADAALALRQLETGLAVDDRPGGHGLREGHVDRRPLPQPVVEAAGVLLRGAGVPALAAAGAFFHVDVAGLLADRDAEVAHEALDRLDLAVGVQSDVGVLADIDHSRREDALRAVEGGKGLAEAGHLAADGRFAFHEGDAVAGLGDVERRLDARHSAADHHRPPRERDGDGGQGVVETGLGHGHADQVDGLGRGRGAVVMDPGAVLADVGHFDEVGIQALLLRRLAERAEVHVRRTGGDDHAREPFGRDLLPHEGLSRLRAHVLAGGRAGHARQLPGGGGHLLERQPCGRCSRRSSTRIRRSLP